MTTEPDGKKYPTKHYNLDAVIAVGYRINSKPSFIALLNTEDSAMNSLSTVPRDMRPLNLREGDLRRTSMQAVVDVLDRDVGNHLLRNRRLQNTVDAVSFFPLSLFIPGDLVTVLNQKIAQRNMGTFLFRAEFKRCSKFFSFRFCGKRFLLFTAAGIPQNPLCTVLSF